MKHLIYSAAIAIMAASCSSEEIKHESEYGKAKMEFCLTTSECPVEIISRATPVPDVDDFTIKISNNGEMIKTGTLKELKKESPVFLEASDNGTDYEVEAYSCENPGDAILDKPYFYGSKITTVVKDETATAEVICSLQQFMISFVPSSEFMSSFRTDTNVEEQGGEKFKLIVTDENGREVPFTFSDLNKSAYFNGDKTSSYIKIKIMGTTVKGFPVNFTDIIEPEDGKLEMKDHLIIKLNVSENNTLKIKASNLKL